MLRNANNGWGGDGRGSGGGGHTANGGDHEDDGTNDDLGSSYYSDGEGNAHRDGRNPRNHPEPAPRAVEDDPCDLVGPPVFGYQIRSAPMPKSFMLQTLTNTMVR